VQERIVQGRGKNVPMAPTSTEPDPTRSDPWLRRGVAVLVVGSLLVFDPRGWAVFGPAKWMVVTTASLMAAAFLLRRRVPVHRSSTFVWLGFLAWGVVVSVFAVDPLYAWIGTPDRHLGLLAWFLFFVMFLVGQAIESDGSTRYVIRAAVVALLGIGVYAVMELLDAAPVDLSAATSRLGGPFGSAAYLGAACALLVPIAVGAVIDGLESRAWRIASGLATVLGTIALVGSQTRAAWLGVAVAGGVVLPAVRSWLRRLRWVPVAAGLLLAALLIISPAGARVRAVFDAGNSEARGRLAEWRVAADLIAARPVFGAGFEGHRIVFPGEVDAAYERAYGRQVTPDRAHSGVLDIGVTTGVPGMLVYVTAVVWLLGRGVRGIRSGRPLLVGVAAGVVAYLFQQQMLFPLAEVDPVFWLMAGILVAATATGERNLETPRSSAGMVLAAGLAIAMLGFGILDVRADQLAEQALTASASGDGTTALQHADAASALRPDSIRYPVVAGGVAAAAGTAQGMETAVARIDKALELSPRDPILRIRRATYLLDSARTTGSDADLAAAQTAWTDVAATDPNNAEVQLQLGVVLALTHDAAGAEQAWLRAESLAPNSVAPLANLARLYAAAGLPEEARGALERARAIDPDFVGLSELESLVEQAGG
jgi:O-antigen ligase/Flp pilus assembly protein TadD